MGKDEHYARVQQLTEEALERLALLTPSLTDFVLNNWREIQNAGSQHLSEEERTALVNLSFFYFLGTCIDFLFFLHPRHRRVSIYQHELEHILSVMMTHAKTQQEALAHDPPGDQHDVGTPFSLVDFEEAVRRWKDSAGNH